MWSLSWRLTCWNMTKRFSHIRRLWPDSMQTRSIFCCLQRRPTWKPSEVTITLILEIVYIAPALSGFRSVFYCICHHKIPVWSLVVCILRIPYIWMGYLLIHDFVYELAYWDLKLSSCRFWCRTYKTRLDCTCTTANPFSVLHHPHHYSNIITDSTKLCLSSFRDINLPSF